MSGAMMMTQATTIKPIPMATAGASLHPDSVVDPPRRCKFARWLRKKEDPSKNLMVRVDCDSWGCADCGPKLRTKWQFHLRDALTQSYESHGGVSDHVNIAVVSEADWTATRARIRRRGGEFCRMVLETGDLWVLNTGEEGEAVSPDYAVEKAHTVINDLPGDHRRISTSSGWQLPKDETPSNWEVVSEPSVSIPDARAALEAIGIVTQTIASVGITGFAFSLPASLRTAVALAWLLQWIEQYPSHGPPRDLAA